MMLAVDVISDVICPWCFIGKRRLEKAVAVLEGAHEVRVRWLPFQLNPQMPEEGISRREYRTRKFGSWERSLELDAQVAAAGAGEGNRAGSDTLSGSKASKSVPRNRTPRTTIVSDPFSSKIVVRSSPKRSLYRAG